MHVILFKKVFKYNKIIKKMIYKVLVSLREQRFKASLFKSQPGTLQVTAIRSVQRRKTIYWKGLVKVIGFAGVRKCKMMEASGLILRVCH